MKSLDINKITGKDFKPVSIEPKKKFSKRKLIIPLIVAVMLFALFVTINNFFNTYFFTFQTPVIFQSPVLMHKREVRLLSPIPEGVAHAQEPVEVIRLTEGARASMERNPIVTSKIKEVFGSKWQDAIELFHRESSLNPGAINPTSGACGLVQALPCSKLKCEFADVECQVKWGYDYVNNRYGDVSKALEFHDKKNWY